MKRSFLFTCLCICCLYLSAQTGNNTTLNELNRAIDSAQQYDARKYESIQHIKATFASAKDNRPAALYDFYLELYEAYKIFKFDTAFLYAKQLEQVAEDLRDTLKMAQAKIKLSFVLLSAGMYGEADDVMSKIVTRNQPPVLMAEYYLLKGRYYYDVADYDNDNFFYPSYFKKAGQYLDSALSIFSTSSFEYIYYTGLKQMKTGDPDKAFANFHTLLKKPDLTEHQLALTASTLSYIYSIRKEKDAAISYQATAAIADIRSSTKETFAVLNLAQMLFEQGDFKRASRYIKKAIDDASSYGARQRKVQVSTIMPIIQGSEINYIDNQRKLWILYGAVVSLVLILFAFLLFIIKRQNKNLTKAKKEISTAHEKLHDVNNRLEQLNTELRNVNANLLDVNAKLEDANKIKDEYVGYFFTINSELFQKLEKFKTSVEEKIHYGKFSEVKYIVNAINIKNEKEELLKSFDRAFLKLFPHFVAAFNALFDDEHQVKLQEGELLNTDMRIYALLRLGVKENEKIAEILEYSVKSIYAYKTRIRNRAKFPRDEFDKKVMDIKSI